MKRVGKGANVALDEKAKLIAENKDLVQKVEVLTKQVEALTVDRDKALKEVETLKKKVEK